MSLLRGHTVDVPGACLYYEVQGSGPPLMLVGHPMGASGFAASLDCSPMTTRW